MKYSEFLAEIHTELSNYSDSNDIDDISIKGWVITCLRQLGLNICTVDETIVKVKNSQAKLPDSFRALKLALKLAPIGCNNKTVRENTPYIYYERIENPAYWDELSGEYIRNCDTKIVTEQVTINNQNVDFYYNYEYLSLVKGISKNSLAADCLNLHPAIRSSYPNQINITGSTLNTNFTDGDVYIQYYSLPTEDGELYIPEITTLDILEYVKMYVKSNIAEGLIINNKNPQGLTQLYPLWQQKLPLFKSAALKEAKFYGLSKNWNKKYKLQSKIETAKYNLPSLKF